MELELHITKKENWFDTNPQFDISIDEWIAYVKMDPEMRLDNFSEVILDGGEIYRYNNPGAAVWFNQSGEHQTSAKTTFDFLSGNITVKNPAPGTLEKMRHIAFKLGAKLQGSEGESLAGIPEYNPADATELVTATAKAGVIKKLWWKLQSSLFISASRK